MFILGTRESFIRTRAAGKGATAERNRGGKEGNSASYNPKRTHTRVRLSWAQGLGWGVVKGLPLGLRAGPKKGQEPAPNRMRLKHCGQPRPYSRLQEAASLFRVLGSTASVLTTGLSCPLLLGSAAAGASWAAPSLPLLVHLPGDGLLAGPRARKGRVLDAEHAVQHVLNCSTRGSKLQKSGVKAEKRGS